MPDPFPRPMGSAQSSDDTDEDGLSISIDRLRNPFGTGLLPRIGWLLPVIGWVVYALVVFQSSVQAVLDGDPVDWYFILYYLVVGNGIVLIMCIILTVIGMSLQWQWEDHNRSIRLQERYEKLVKTAPDAILAVNDEGLCQVANGSLVKLLGLNMDEIEAEDVVGRPLSELIGVDASDALAKAAGKLDDESKAIYNLELDLVTAEGKVPVLASLALTGEGETTLQFKDMREYEETQSLLRLFHNAFMHSNDAIIFTDSKARILEVNQAFTSLYGYSRQEVIGHNPRIVRSDRTPKQTYEQLWKSLTRQGFWTGRLINQTKDGTIIHIMLSITALTDDGGNLQGYLGFAVNLTHQKILEEEMEEARFRYRNLVENSTDLIFTLDTGLNLTFANSQFKEQLGHDPESLPGTDFLKLIPPDQRRWLAEALRHGLEHHEEVGNVLNLELSIRAADRSLRHYIVSGAIIFNEMEEVIGVGAMGRNITRENELTERLAESEARHRMLLEHMQEMVYQVNPLGLLTFVNPAFIRFFGFKTEEAALGTSIVKLHSNSVDWETLLRQLHKEKAVQDHQLSMTCLDGTPVVISSHSQVILDDEGEFIGVEGSMRDVTDKIALERKAREFAHFALLNPAPVLRLDIGGIIELANPGARKLFSKEIEGQAWSDIFNDSPDPVKLLSTEVSDTGLFTWETPVGAHYYHFTFLSKSNEGKIYVYGLDLTERRSLEREREELLKLAQSNNEALEEKVARRTENLVQSEKMAALGQLVAGVAHEINNPLGFLKANLSNFSEYFEELQGFREALVKLPMPEEMAKELQYYGKVIEHGRNESLACQEGVERIASITRSLRLFAHPKEERLAPSDLNEGLKHTLVLLRPSLQNIEVKLDLKPLPPVVCNPGQINQVVMNLLTNAIQALKGEGSLEVRTWCEGKMVYLDVEDCGPGIDPKDLSNIFVPFFTTKPEGTGLGLAISYRLVKEHQGELEVDTKVGRGTRMRLILPINGPVPDHRPDEKLLAKG